MKICEGINITSKTMIEKISIHDEQNLSSKRPYFDGANMRLRSHASNPKNPRESAHEKKIIQFHGTMAEIIQFRGTLAVPNGILPDIPSNGTVFL